jgi:hypothetical protein
MDQSAVAAILIRHRAAKKVVAKSAVGHRLHLLCSLEPSPPARTEPLAERLLTAQHVGVAPSIVNNNPETTERGRRSFPAAAGWFSHVASFGRNAQGTAALMLRSIAARRSTSVSTDWLRCDASRSMRASTVAVLILRDARTPIRLCRAVGARALLRMRTGECVANCGSSLNRSL